MMLQPCTSPALRYHGAKFRLASWVMQFFPPHACYTEAFGGAAGVLLRKPRSYAEVYNDLDGDIVNFFAVLRDPVLRDRLIEAVTLTPYARAEFEQAWEDTECPVERARRVAIRAQMGFGSAGATKGSTGFRVDTRRKHGTAQHNWLNYPSAIANAGARFEGVLIENRQAAEVLSAHDGVDVLHFVDPPYVHSTRVVRAQGGYRHEMSDADHIALIEVLKSLRGMVVLSGYPSPVYSERLSSWQSHSTSTACSAGRGAATRTEVVWINPACAAALNGSAGPLFGATA